MDDFSIYSRRSRLPNEESVFLHSKFEDSLKVPMKPIIDAHTELQETYNNIDNLINEVVSQNEWLLNSRYLARLKQEEEKLLHIKEQIQKDYDAIENNPEVYKLDREIKSFIAQKEALSRFSFQLKTQKDHYRHKFNEEKDYVASLKEQLKEVTKENLQISYTIEGIKGKTLESSVSRYKFPGLSSKYSVSNLISQSSVKLELLSDDQKGQCYGLMEELNKVKKEIKDTKEASQHLSSLQGAFLSEQKKLEEFFQECFQMAKVRLLQNQQMPQINKKGLAGSLFFDLIQNEKSSNVNTMIQDKTYRSHLQERDSSNVLYYTVKRMINTARNDQKKLQISQIQLGKDDFESFTSLQVLGLLCLRNDIQVELHNAVFPANLLHIQHTNISELKRSKTKKNVKKIK